jgi:hypothetical protein
LQNYAHFTVDSEWFMCGHVSDTKNQYPVPFSHFSINQQQMCRRSAICAAIASAGDSLGRFIVAGTLRIQKHRGRDHKSASTQCKNGEGS